MLFTEREPFVHSGAQSDVSAWNKAGNSFGTKLWQRSHVVGWKSTSSNTRRRLRRVLERNRDISPTNAVYSAGLELFIPNGMFHVRGNRPGSRSDLVDHPRCDDLP